MALESIKADTYGAIEWVYPKEEADKVIAEKDKEIARSDDLAHNIELLRKENLIAELEAHKDELEEPKPDTRPQAEIDEENRKLKRALWLTRVARAHAEWSHWATIWFCDTTIELNINKSSVSQVPYCCTIKRNAAQVCRVKAEEYK